MKPMSPTTRPVLLAFAALGLAGCASNRLHEFEYADHTLAVVAEIPRRPDVLSGPLWPDFSGDPVRAVLRGGAMVVREVEARAIQERLDEATRRVDVGRILEDRTAERTARYLAADLVAPRSGEDYVLELIVAEYGIDAEEWEAAAHFFVQADATLLEAASGTEIWRKEIHARDPIGPGIYGADRGVRDAITAATLADLSVEEIALALEALADYAAGAITDELREDLRDARRR